MSLVHKKLAYHLFDLDVLFSSRWKTDNTYIYKQHYIFGYGKKIDNCSGYDDLCEKQRKSIDSMDETLKLKDKNYRQPDIIHWACHDQGTVGKLRKGIKERNSQNKPSSFII